MSIERKPEDEEGLAAALAVLKAAGPIPDNIPEIASVVLAAFAAVVRVRRRLIKRDKYIQDVPWIVASAFSVWQYGDLDDGVHPTSVTGQYLMAFATAFHAARLTDFAGSEMGMLEDEGYLLGKDAKALLTLKSRHT